MNPSNCAECGNRVIELNEALVDWTTSKNNHESPVILVDLWTGFNDSTDTVDGVHPNDLGNGKMADAWFEPLSQAIQG